MFRAGPFVMSLFALFAQPGPQILAGDIILAFPVEEIQPAPVTHILVGFTIRALVQTGGIMNIGKNAGVHLGIHRLQTRQRGCLVDRRVHMVSFSA